MIVDLHCSNTECGGKREAYFPTYSIFKKKEDKKEFICSKCGATENRKYSAPIIGRSGEYPGYEKSNDGNLTMGKIADHGIEKAKRY